ncbi:heavy metal translocating P-type ATPase [Paroceanicella profunda]|nr:heavy metal translocating P-type ATPase [Paroceanicella profunda]
MTRESQHEWRVTGMDCGACAAKVRGAVAALPGVGAVDVALMAERLSLTLDETLTPRAGVERAVRRLGYGIGPRGAAPQKPARGFVMPADAAPSGPDHAAALPDPQPAPPVATQGHASGPGPSVPPDAGRKPAPAQRPAPAPATGQPAGPAHHDPHAAGETPAGTVAQGPALAHPGRQPGAHARGHAGAPADTRGTAPAETGLAMPPPAPAATAGDSPAGAPGASAAPAGPDADPARHSTPKARLLLGTGALLALAWAVDLAVGGRVAQAGFMLATLIGLAPVARRAGQMAAARMPFTIEMLMTIAATGALVIGAAQEAALVVFLFALGETLEGLAAGRARSGIRALAALVPRTARVVVGSTIRDLPAESLAIGHLVQVRPGDRIPADGTVATGISAVDESPVTGESLPRPVSPGDTVFAGAINTGAELRIRVSTSFEDNTISRILRLVEEAGSARAPTERFIDRFSRVYMPAVVGAALLVAVLPPLLAGAPWETWVYRGLALLLIGCPCALVISVPASIASALSTGARHGLLLKGGAVLEATAGVTCVAFDKTGTLTEGRPRIVALRGIAQEETGLLATAAAVEAGASHPLGRAILARAEAEGCVLPPATGAAALPGRGARATIDGQDWTVGSPDLAAQHGLVDPATRAWISATEETGATVVAVFTQSRLAGLIALRDEPRADAATAVADLRRMGITPVMLSGDTPRTAQAIAQRIGLAARAGLLPQDKVTAIRDLAAATPGARVMMVGDGINDAPALATAQVGLAMGSGTDVALETADGALLRDRVGDVVIQIRLARATMANIHQNVAIALGLKGVFLVTTLLGVTGLWPAILADTGATVLVTLNALRLLRFSEPRRPA